jgi:hypothetical protein
MTFLPRSHRCRLFEEIASNTWKQVMKYHRHGIHLAEIGKTNEIIVDIKESNLGDRNIGIWAANGIHENIFGSDIDIFVETKPGLFVWWALQAKVLSVDGTYKGLTKASTLGYQWDKLDRLADLSGCFARYLLYNGVADYQYFAQDACKRTFEEDQFGCSLVETHDMARIALAGVPRFDDFHPQYAQPWRTIACCLMSTKYLDVGYYSAAQIEDAVKYYPDRDASADFFPQTIELELKNLERVDAIRVYSREAGWEPAYRMVLRSTRSLRGG